MIAKEFKKFLKEAYDKKILMLLFCASKNMKELMHSA